MSERELHVVNDQNCPSGDLHQCANGHVAARAAKFCQECGVPVIISSEQEDFPPGSDGPSSGNEREPVKTASTPSGARGTFLGLTVPAWIALSAMTLVASALIGYIAYIEWPDPHLVGKEAIAKQCGYPVSRIHWLEHQDQYAYTPPEFRNVRDALGNPYQEQEPAIDKYTTDVSGVGGYIAIFTEDFGPHHPLGSIDCDVPGDTTAWVP